jgi:hypothetical protein
MERAAPLIVRFDIGSRYASTAAGLALKEGRWRAAAQLLGYSEAATLRAGMDAEEPAEMFLRERAVAALYEEQDAKTLEHLKQQGKALSTDQAYRLTLSSESGAPSQFVQLSNAW